MEKGEEGRRRERREDGEGGMERGKRSLRGKCEEGEGDERMNIEAKRWR